MGKKKKNLARAVAHVDTKAQYAAYAQTRKCTSTLLSISDDLT